MLLLLSMCLIILWTPQLNSTTRDSFGRKPIQVITLSGDESGSEGTLGGITWPQFQNLCVSPGECSELYGLPIRWEGRVADTRLLRIHNPLAEMLHRLPYYIQSIVKCWFGDKYRDKGDSIINSGETVPSQLLGECHLKNWNRYEYEVEVAMTSGVWRTSESIVKLVGLDNSFYNITSSLRVGDHIWYSGSLVGGNSGLINANEACIETESLGCLFCKDESINNEIAKKEKMFSILSIYSGIKAILNFVFNPLVIFR